MEIHHYIEKFMLLTWKNHTSQWSKKLEFFSLLFMPTLFCAVAMILYADGGKNQRVDRQHAPIDLDRSWLELIETLESRLEVAAAHKQSENVFIPQLVVGWAPEEYKFFAQLMKLSIIELSPMTLRSFVSCDDMIEAMQKESLFTCICFESEKFEKNITIEEMFQRKGQISVQLDYAIMFPSELRIYNDTTIGSNWLTNYKDDPKRDISMRLSQPYDGGYVGYVREGFIKVQKTISETFLTAMGAEKLPNIVLRRFPVFGSKDEGNLDYMNRGLSVLVIVGFLFPAQLLVWQIVREKECQRRMFMINMGVSNAIHFFAWFFKGLVYMIFSSILIIILLKVKWYSPYALLNLVPWNIMFMIFISYNIATTAFCMMIASFFKDVILSVRVLTLMWIFSFLPFFVIWNNPEKTVLLVRYIIGILPNCMVALILEGLIERELIYHKDWSSQGFALNYARERINLYHSTWVFYLATVLFCAIGLYMDVWNTGQLSGNQHNRRSSRSDLVYNENEENYAPHSNQPIGINSTKIYEVEPSHRKFKVKIKKLCKRYEDTTALNMFTWNVYENEVTILMGHNGSGKTTLLKILGGLLDPTHGSVSIDGHNLQTERTDACMMLGIALSDGLLLPDLMVGSHIWFVCQLKGMTSVKSKEEVNLYIQMLKMDHLKYRLVRTLTIPERNLLHICCAFVGGSNIILIDDLHSDLDISTQTLIWDLINEEKSKRTIILVSNSTHLTERLADRLAIMSNGELKCTGTKPFLRNMYGHGYRLTCIKDKNCDIEQLHELLSNHLPNLTIESDVGYKTTVVLETKYEDHFSALLDELEEEMNRLGIISFSIRDTSMEEIFLRFGSEENKSANLVMNDSFLTVSEDFNTLIDQFDQKVKGKSLFILHVYCIFYKRLIAAKNMLTIKVINVVALLVAICFTYGSLLLYGKGYQLAPLSFNLSQLHYIDAFVETMSDEPYVMKMSEIYSELMFWYDAHLYETSTTDDDDFFMLRRNEFAKSVNIRYMFGASFGEKTTTAWFNNVPLHSAPYSLNAVHNAMARNFISEEASIDVRLKPLRFQTRSNTFPPSPITMGCLLAINLSFCFCYVWSGMVSFMIRERKSSFKRTQVLAGATLPIFWIVTFIFHMIEVAIMSIWVILVTSLFLNPSNDLKLLSWLFLVIFLSGIAVISVAYCLSIFFDDPIYGFIIISYINVMGVILFISVANIRKELLRNVPDMYQPLTQYTLCEIIFKLFLIFRLRMYCRDDVINFVSTKVAKCQNRINCCGEYIYWTGDEGVRFEFFVLLCTIFIACLIIIVEEYYSLRASACMRRSIPEEKKQNEGSDHKIRKSEYEINETVVAERQRVERLGSEDRKYYAVICQGVGKNYRNKEVLKRIDLCINRGECVGLMGPNNFAKSLLAKLLVGEQSASHGRIWIRGYSMETQRTKCYPQIGYASQYDRLPGEFTPRELLLIHAMLHGHSRTQSVFIADGLASRLGFQSSYLLPLQLCTPGQYRRFTFALAILGNPTFVCIDGAPAGVDPTGKRVIFRITTTMQQHGVSFMYTKLKAVDCERVCQRTPVLYNGRLWAIGAQDEQERYRNGYLLEVHFKRKNTALTVMRTTWDRVSQTYLTPHQKFTLFMADKFPEAVIEEENYDAMIFFIPLESATFSKLFLVIRKDAFEMNVEDFYITRNLLNDMQKKVVDGEDLSYEDDVMYGDDIKK